MKLEMKCVDIAEGRAALIQQGEPQPFPAKLRIPASGFSKGALYLVSIEEASAVEGAPEPTTEDTPVAHHAPKAHPGKRHK